MTNMMKDYYKILGVSETCTEQELKRAYRALARRWHPDVAGNSENILLKFKEINEAYETLSDKSKRAQYDTVNRYYNYSSAPKSENNSAKNATKPNFSNNYSDSEKKDEKKSSGFNFNWDEFVSKYKDYAKKYQNNEKREAKYAENNSKAKYGNSQKGSDIYADVEISVSESVSGTTKIINMLNTTVCPYCGGRKFINGSVCSHCNGKGEKSEHKRFTIKIPSGIKDNSKIRLAGEGNKGLNGGANGDLYIKVHIIPPFDYKIEGINILKTVFIAPYEAVLGGNVNIRTQNGNVNVKISPNTQSGQKIRLSGCGLNQNGIIGDMILTIEIQIPKNLTVEEIDLYKKLQQLCANRV